MAFKVSSEDALPANVLAALRAQGQLDAGEAAEPDQADATAAREGNGWATLFWWGLGIAFVVKLGPVAVAAFAEGYQRGLAGG